MNKLIKFSGAKGQAGVPAVSSKEIKFYLGKSKTILVLAMFLFAGLQGCKKDSLKQEDVSKNSTEELIPGFELDMELLKDETLSSITYTETKEGVMLKKYFFNDTLSIKELQKIVEGMAKWNGKFIIELAGPNNKNLKNLPPLDKIKRLNDFLLERGWNGKPNFKPHPVLLCKALRSDTYSFGICSSNYAIMGVWMLIYYNKTHISAIGEVDDKGRLKRIDGSYK